MNKALLALSKTHCGPGGLKCSCCNPAFGKFRGEGSQENRKRAKRAYRRSEKQRAKREVNQFHKDRLQDFIELHNECMTDMAIYDQYIGYRPFDGLYVLPDLEELYVLPALEDVCDEWSIL